MKGVNILKKNETLDNTKRKATTMPVKIYEKDEYKSELEARLDTELNSTAFFQVLDLG